eukprot:jgi/Psemu1/303391/fgenesh1_kg.103_\
MEFKIYSIFLLLALLLGRTAGFATPPERIVGPRTQQQLQTKPTSSVSMWTSTSTPTPTTRLGVVIGGGGGGGGVVEFLDNYSFSSSLLVAQESWRQYVPLVVSLGIIVDILLGSPLANMVLKPMRPDDGNGSDNNDNNNNNDGNNKKPRSRARIDAELVAKQALDRASNTMELRKFLDERKTDYDRMEDMKRELDKKMQDLDEDMEARQKSIDSRQQ